MYIYAYTEGIKVFIVLFLVLIKGMRRLGESKIFLSFLSDLIQAKWCHLVCLDCLQIIKPIVVGFCSFGSRGYRR